MAIRPLIFHHFWLKLFSVVLAVLIWLTVRGTSGETTRTFPNRPILVLTDTSQHPTVAINPTEASITVRGPLSLLQEITDYDINVFVRLADRSQFSGELPIRVHVPSGASVVLITPATTFVKSTPSL
jgi:hypothetical protein